MDGVVMGMTYLQWTTNREIQIEQCEELLSKYRSTEQHTHDDIVQLCEAQVNHAKLIHRGVDQSYALQLTIVILQLLLQGVMADTDRM